MTLHHTKEECKRLAGGRVEACRLRRISRGQPFEGAFVAAKPGAIDINGDTWAGWPTSQRRIGAQHRSGADDDSGWTSIARSCGCGRGALRSAPVGRANGPEVNPRGQGPRAKGAAARRMPRI